MTNEEIITNIAVSIYGEDKVKEMLADGLEIPLHTFKGWSDRNYHVKKGEKGIECRLWKKRKRRDVEDNDDSNQESRVPNERDFIMVKSYLFRSEQVEEFHE